MMHLKLQPEIFFCCAQMKKETIKRLAGKTQKDIPGDKTSPKASRLSPKNKQGEFSHSRPLTTSEMKHLEESTAKATKFLKGKFTSVSSRAKRGHMGDKNNWRRRVFNTALEKANLRKVRIHDLRHTYATLRVAKGDNIADVSNQLGHHSVKLTMDVYYHWIPGKKKAEVDGLDDSFPMIPSVPPCTLPRPQMKMG